MELAHGMLSLAKIITSPKEDKKEIILSQSIQEILTIIIPFLATLSKNLKAPESDYLSRPTIVLTAHNKEALSLFTNLNRILSERTENEVMFLPYICFWGKDRFENHETLVNQRLKCLNSLSIAQNPIIITTLAGLMQTTITPDLYSKKIQTISVGMDIEHSTLIERLRDNHFRETSSEYFDPGTFILKGSICDIYPQNSDLAYRISFFADQVEKIQVINPVNFKSVRLENSIQLGCGKEFFVLAEDKQKFSQNIHKHLINLNILKNEREKIVDCILRNEDFLNLDIYKPLYPDKHYKSFFLDHLRKNYNLILSHSKDYIEAKYRELIETFTTLYNDETANFTPSVSPKHHFHLEKSLRNIHKGCINTIYFNCKENYNINWNISSHKNLDTLNLIFSKELIWKTIKYLRSLEYKIFILISNDRHRRVVSDLLYQNNMENDYQIILFQDYFDQSSKNRELITLCPGEIHDHYIDFESQFIVISGECFAKVNRFPGGNKNFSVKKVFNHSQSLSKGDYVTHAQYGIGKYQGFVSLEIGTLAEEFALIEYFGGDKIYTAIDRVNLIEKYTSHKEGNIKLDNLRKNQKNSWLNRKQKAQESAEKLAKQLIENEAKRKIVKINRVPIDQDLYQEFIAQFPFEETEDQLKAQFEIEHDLSLNIPMDRLLVGDVGFGKTEVAMRAAFHSVLAGYQVYIFVPTTVLSFQHFETFHDRLSPFGVKVASLNRFVANNKQKKIIEELSTGKIDIVIGTHKLLSGKISPAKLGMIIIDEEHKFGVTHKEKLKKISSQIDVLSLTATPIPRTLHMSVIGLRNISVLATSPKNRLPVKTYFCKFNPESIKIAIDNELSRNGQVFFLHNRVHDLNEIASKIANLNPKFKVAIGHGQMTQDSLEKIIVSFLNQEFNIFVCTTIIESGIDMPNVNTIIINDAHKFGLSTLYQLRGRVGRSNVQAYTYLLSNIPEDSPNLERINVILRNQDIGSGFTIASQDLEIRGAGNLLGAEQSGQIESVGFNCYTRTLKAAIDTLKGLSTEMEVDPEIILDKKPFLPPTYINEEKTRMNLYQEIFSSQEDSEIFDIQERTIDTFGPPPDLVIHLFLLGILRIYLKKLKIKKLSQSKDTFSLQFDGLKKENILSMISYFEKENSELKLNADFSIIALLENDKYHSSIEKTKKLINILKDFLNFK